MNYFEGVSVSEARKRLILLVKEHHPDKGGDAEVMRLINAQYAELKESGSVYYTNPANGFDPFSRRRLRQTPPAQPTRPTRSYDYGWKAYSQGYGQKESGSKSRNHVFWEQELGKFQSASRIFSRSQGDEAYQAMVELQAKNVIRAALDLSGMNFIDELGTLRVSDIGTKWVTFSASGLTYTSSYLLRKYIRMVSKKYPELKLYRPKLERLYEGNYILTGIQIRFKK